MGLFLLMVLELLIMKIIVMGGALFLVFSSSPSYGVMGVLVQAIFYAGLLAVWSSAFMALILILIYVGAMLIVFLFATLLSAERHLQAKGVEFVMGLCFFVFLILPLENTWEMTGGVVTFVKVGIEEEIGELFSILAPLTCFVGLFLLMGLMMMLNLGFNHKSGALRAI